MLRFVVTLPNGKEVTLSADGDNVYIGRAPMINDICINDSSMSRQHARITKKKKKGYIITDLRSLNGVVLNDKKISRAALHDGDLFCLGEIKIRVQIDDAGDKKSAAQSVDALKKISDVAPTDLEKLREEMGVLTMDQPRDSSQLEKAKARKKD